jgi:hypothetical protein
MSEDKALKAATQAVAALKYDKPNATAREVAEAALDAAESARAAALRDYSFADFATAMNLALDAATLSGRDGGKLTSMVIDELLPKRRRYPKSPSRILTHI